MLKILNYGLNIFVSQRLKNKNLMFSVNNNKKNKTTVQCTCIYRMELNSRKTTLPVYEFSLVFCRCTVEQLVPRNFVKLQASLLKTKKFCNSPFLTAISITIKKGACFSSFYI